MIGRCSLILLLFTGMAIPDAHAQPDKAYRPPNRSDFQLGYLYSAVAHQVPADYIHSFGRHGVVVGVRYLAVRGGYRTASDPASAWGLSLGYQYRFGKDAGKALQPFITYRFLYNLKLDVRTLSPSVLYTPQQQALLAGLRFFPGPNLYGYLSAGVLHTTYVAIGGVNADMRNRNEIGFTFQAGIGCSLVRGRKK